jgi:hypothetical protein
MSKGFAALGGIDVFTLLRPEVEIALSAFGIRTTIGDKPCAMRFGSTRPEQVPTGLHRRGCATRGPSGNSKAR